MIIIRKLKAAAVLFVFIMLLWSCSKEDNHYSNFKSSELAVNYSEAYITGLMSVVSGLYPEASSLIESVSGGVNVYRIIYETDAGGKEFNASGLVCIPEGKGQWPVLCFLNGTNTVNDYAPSNFFSDTRYQLIELAASTGYIIVIPDYPGFGASSELAHPYLVKEPTVESVTDMLRAVKEAAGSIQDGAAALNEYYLAGYSQGGWAAMAMHKSLELETNTEFDLKGTVCGAGPYDIEWLLADITGQQTYSMPVYPAYIINAYSGWDEFTNPVSDILNEPYSSRLSSLFNGQNDFSTINSQLTTSITGLFKAEFLAGYTSGPEYLSVRDAIKRNSISPWETGIKLLMFHGSADTDVAPGVTDYFYDKMIEAGSSTETITKINYDGLGHGEAGIPGLIEGLIYLFSLRD